MLADAIDFTFCTDVWLNFTVRCATIEFFSAMHVYISRTNKVTCSFDVI